jgi:hypothetical protein
MPAGSVKKNPPEIVVTLCGHAGTDPVSRRRFVNDGKPHAEALLGTNPSLQAPEALVIFRSRMMLVA